RGALFGVHVPVRVRQHARAVRRPARLPGLRDGRRLGERRRPRLGVLAFVEPRPRARVHAERLGHRLCRGRPRRRRRAAPLRLARGVLRRNPARVLRAVGPAAGQGAADLDGGVGRAGAVLVDLQERHRHSHAGADADEHLHAVRVVGLQPVAAELPEVAALGAATTTTFLFVMQAGMWLGYVSYGFISDRIGRKKSYVSYLLSAAVLLAVYVTVRNPTLLLLLGPCVAFAATGYFSGFGAVTAEVYPTSIRATAQGFTYNIGRVASAAAPYLVGTLADTHGFGAALLVCSAAFVAAAVLWIWIPETRGRVLT